MFASRFLARGTFRYRGQLHHHRLVQQQNIHTCRHHSNMAQINKPTSDSPLVRLMVLETDKPHPDTASDRGSFGQIVHHHFSKAGEAHHPPLAVETDQVFVVTEQGGRIPKKEEFEGYHGLLITGSMFDAHGNNQWILDLLTLLKGIPHPSLHLITNLTRRR